MSFEPKNNLLSRLVGACLDHKALVLAIYAFVIIAGVFVAPFAFDLPGIQRKPLAVDAVPDIGEKQQIIFTEWMGRSPKEVENQITYPLAALLQGTPGVKTIRSYSYFGASFIYVIFEDRENFYDTRSRLLEKLSIAKGRLPEGVTPVLGPDATGLGQIFWYTLEGEGFSPAELRSFQDWNLRYALQSCFGVSEVASIGGFTREYQVDVDPEKLRLFRIPLERVQEAVRDSNIDVGAMTIDVNRVEYMIRGLGAIHGVSDVENIPLRSEGMRPLRVKDVARVSLGPALRRGILDKNGREAVGGVVVARYGANPMDVIRAVKIKIAELKSQMPEKVLADGRVSKLRIEPFYDRSVLIEETLGTLKKSLEEEILITIIVVLTMIFHFRVSFLISLILPLGVLMTFVLMKVFGVESNVMSLSGIAIAIGAMVDMGIITLENLTKVTREAEPGTSPRQIIVRSASEVGPAILTSSLTIIVSFLPIFWLTGAEGKMFTPLAWTKTFAISASVVLAITLLPILAEFMLFRKKNAPRFSSLILLIGILASAAFAIWVHLGVGILLGLFFLSRWLRPRLTEKRRQQMEKGMNAVVVATALLILAHAWMPLGHDRWYVTNAFFVAALVLGFLGFFWFLYQSYERVLRFFLVRKKLFLSIPLVIAALGFISWLGWERIFSFIPNALPKSWGTALSASSPWRGMSKLLPGLNREFMPPLDEGSFLYMPTTMPHASVTEISEVLRLLDMRLKSIPEVESVVGKAGRVDSALDPAPLNMIETMVSYKPKFARDPETGKTLRQWRPGIETSDDIWKELSALGEIPGLTGAPKLQPIAARIVMLQTGLRAPMGVKIKGPSLEKVEEAGRLIEEKLKAVEELESAAVIADRVIGTPYLEIVPNREKLALYGMTVGRFQENLEIAVGGKSATTVLEGRERLSVRLRYEREKRDRMEALGDLLFPLPEGLYLPLSQLAEIRYARGPMVIKGEDSFLVSYVLFDKKKSVGEVEAVERAGAFLEREKKNGGLILPDGVHYSFTGNYENQVRSQKTLGILIPLVLLLIFFIFYVQLRNAFYALFIFSSVLTAFSGGMVFLDLFGREWFSGLHIFGLDLGNLFNIHPISLSVAVWVGFLALFGVAANDGVVMGTYLRDRFVSSSASTLKEVRELVVEAGKRRVLPSLMTTATTTIALLPVLTSKGRGSDLMIPMAVPILGGMLVSLVSIYIVPVLVSLYEERRRMKRVGPFEAELGESEPGSAS